MTLSTELAVGEYFGVGDGDESGQFLAKIVVSRLPNGGTLVEYDATSRDEGVLHREQTMLVAGPDGLDRLYIAHSESPFVTEMIEVGSGSGYFAQPVLSGPYEMEIRIETPEVNRITYAWWWGADGQPPVEQSKADVRRRE